MKFRKPKGGEKKKGELKKKKKTSTRQGERVCLSNVTSGNNFNDKKIHEFHTNTNKTTSPIAMIWKFRGKLKHFGQAR